MTKTTTAPEPTEDKPKRELPPTGRISQELRAKALPSKHAQRREYERNTWCLKVPGDPDLDTLTDPYFWLHYTRKFNPLDQLEVHTGTTYYEFIVMAVDHIAGTVDLVPKCRVDTPSPESVDHGDKHFSAKYEGIVDGWVIRRRRDNHVMQKNLMSGQEARSHIVSALSHHQVVV